MSVEDKKRLGRRFFKGYTKLVESKYWYNHYVALIFGASPASNLGSLIAIDWKGNELISVTRFFGNNDNVKLYLGSNPETNMYELWLGLIGLDGDGSEFIIQSRESIDLDSKTVETLPSYLKVISISWQKNNDFSELGELLGNPKGTKSFSSWSEFTDFVNEMPIKTIQPFVSNFNAFAGEGFYGNVVQGLVIKQLEDAVFIFGIAIDGTLIFRKRNYPDVSTWEDPKIIIHSNNWHKIYFVTDLGELIGINDLKRDATIARNSAGANDSYYYNIIPSNVVKCSYLVEILEDRSQPKIYIVSKYYSNYKNDYNVKGVVVGSSMLSVKFFYNDNGDIILSIVASTRSSLVSVKLLCGDSMPSITKIETPSGLTEIPIS